MTDERILQNVRQVHLYLTGECDYQCSYGKVRDAIEKHRTLVPRRGGGFTRATVDAWARAHLVRKVDTSAEASRPVIPVRQELPGAAEQKVAAQAQYLGLKVSKEQFEFAERRGLYVETAIIERELAERQTTVRHLLEGFFRENGGEIIALLGGDIAHATRLAELAGGDGANAEAISAAQFALLPRLLDISARRLREVLNCYATGSWYTEEFATVWERYRANVEATATETMTSLIEAVGGDPALAQAALEHFAVTRKEVA